MKKETIEIYRHKKTLANYSMFINKDHEDYQLLNGDGSPRKSFIMQVICNFSKDKNVQIYEHELNCEDIINEADGFYESENTKMKIPYCDRVYTLDIYYQEK